MTQLEPTFSTPITDLLPVEIFPSAWVENSSLDQIVLSGYRSGADAGGVYSDYRVRLRPGAELVLSLPGLADFAIVIRDLSELALHLFDGGGSLMFRTAGILVRSPEVLFGQGAGAAGAIEPADVKLVEIGDVSVQLARATSPNRSMLVQVTLGNSPAFELHGLRLAIDLGQPWLHQVDPVTRRPVAGSFQFIVDASLVIAANTGADLQLLGLSIPPFEISNTGIIIELNHCQLAAEGRGVPLSLRNLLENSGTQFSGLYAQQARLSWLPQFRFPFAGSPGFSFNFRDVLIDDSGVSFTLDESWTIERDPNAAHKLSPDCGTLGRLFGDRVAVAIERATGTVVRNSPTGFGLDAWIEIAPFQALLKGRLEIQTNPQADTGTIAVTLTQDPASPIRVDLGIGSLEIEGLAVSGLLTNDSVSVEGSARFEVSLPGWNSGSIEVQASFSTNGNTTSLRVALPELGLGPLGRVSNAEFSVEFAADDGGAQRLTSFAIRSIFQWRNLSARLGFEDLPPNLPVPPNDASVQASIQWKEDEKMELSLEAGSSDLSRFFDFLPSRFRPELRSAAFGFRTIFDNPNAFFGARPTDQIRGEAFAKLSFRPALPPELRNNDVVKLIAGDSDGFIDAEIRAVIAEGNANLSLSVASPAALEIGIPGITDGPILSAALTNASISLAEEGGTQGASATIELAGGFSVLPAAIRAPSLLGPHLATLLDPLMNLAIRGSIAGSLKFQDDQAELAMSLQVDGAEIEIDLLDIIGQLSAGPGASRRAESAPQRQSRQELDLDLSLRFALQQLEVQIGKVGGHAGDRLPAAIKLNFSAGLAGANLPAFVQLSTEELVFGLTGATVPLRLPRFPVTQQDLRDVTRNRVWDEQTFSNMLAILQTRIDALAERDDPRAVEERSEMITKHAMLSFIRNSWLPMPPESRRMYQGAIVELIRVLSELTEITASDSKTHLSIGSAQIRVPFANPQSIAAEGQATIKVPDTDDPLHGFNDMTLRLGISPDQIYFGLEASGEPIPIPKFGRYEGGHVSLSQFTIGYGFTRNSLALSFAGELVYPANLTEDFDTSKAIGFGIKLPRHNRVAFRLDMIPVPGPIPLVPLFEFNLDLRTPGVPALTNTQNCRPAFDGLELNIPGVVHADLKALSASPVFGIIPAPNVRFDGDLDVGNDLFGLTVVCDDLIWFAGVGGPPTPFPVTFLFDPFAPYFEHLCVNLRCAGFGINFDLERPFPNPNPLILFEILALVADPQAPIDPGGPLARSVRIALRDAYVSIPKWAQPLIPGSSELVRNEINVELNVKTVVDCVQLIARNVSPVLQQVQDAFESGTAALQQLSANPPEMDSGKLLALLPLDLRILDRQLSFAGFDASATIVIITPGDLRQQNVRANAVWQSSALEGFGRTDLNALPLLSPDATAVICVARIELLNAGMYTFLGMLADDGTFALMTKANVNPLSLSVNGLPVSLPFSFQGRLSLIGKITGARRFASVKAEGRGTWQIFPGVLTVTAGTAKKPVQLVLHSNGHFAVSGSGKASFFNGAVKIDGTLDVSESHLFVSGALEAKFGGTAASPMVKVRADGAVHIGPGKKWGFDGSGYLKLYNLTLADASVRFSDREISVHASLPERRNLRLGNLEFNTPISGTFDGKLAFPADGGLPTLSVRGDGTIQVRAALLTGSFAIDAGPNVLRVAADGTLSWCGRDWFAAKVALSSDGSAMFSGRISVALDLAPPAGAFDIEVASLFLRADLSAGIALNRGGGLTLANIDVNWVLGIKLPEGENNEREPGQTFVLAMQKTRVRLSGNDLEGELFNIGGMNPIPLPNWNFTIPTLTKSGEDEAIISSKIRVLGLDALPLEFVFTAGARSVVNDLINEAEIPGVIANPITWEDTLFMVPKDLKWTTTEYNLAQLGANLGFRVRLKWLNGNLVFITKIGTETERVWQLSELL